jgi:hypothetical protein
MKKERTIFFGNHITEKLGDLYTICSFPNVLITGHQGF